MPQPINRRQLLERGGVTAASAAAASVLLAPAAAAARRTRIAADAATSPVHHATRATGATASPQTTPAPPPTPTFDVTSYGAVGDGQSDDTAAIQAAINASADSNGSVVFPAGIYLSGTISLANNMTLYFDSSAYLKATHNHNSYTLLPTFYPDRHPSSTYPVLIYGSHLSNVGIGGPGAVDGQWQAFNGGGNPNNSCGTYRVDEDWWYTGGATPFRPYLVVLDQCTGVTIQDVTFFGASVYNLWLVTSPG